MKALNDLPYFLREEAAWRRIRGGEPQPAVTPLPPRACREFLHAQVRDNLRSAASWGSGNRFARKFADWQKGLAEGLPFYLEGRPSSGFFARPSK